MENIDSVSINLELNKSHENKRGRFSVRLYVFDKVTKDKYYFKTPFKLSKSDYEGAWVLNKSTARLRNIRLEMLKFLDRVDECIKELGEFDKDEFKSLFYRVSSEKKDLKYYYDKKIEEFNEMDSIGTAEIYQSSYNFLKKYNNNKDLKFNQITPIWLKKFDRYCVEKNRITTSTLGMYLRPLRTIFNRAIHEGAVKQEKYPFSKFGFTIPQSENIKKALSKEQVQLLFDSEPNNFHQKMAKDFWFFSYISGGLNLKDILTLKNKDLKDDFFFFSRKKTLHTVKIRNSVKVHLINFTKKVINDYRNPDSNNMQDYVFDVLNLNMSDAEKHKKKKNFNRKINQHFLKLARTLEIEENISFAWARHSFATISILAGVRLELVSKQLTHTSLETTMLYFKGFEDDTYKQVSDKILDFSKKKL